MATADTTEAHDTAAFWRAMADGARADGRDTAARACDALVVRVTDGLDPSERVAASFEATLAAVGSLLDLHARADVLCHLAGGWDLVGDPASALPLVTAALDAVPGHLDAHLRLAHLRLPGAGYYALLDHLHELIRPRTYLEIGMGDGSSMALVRQGTRAIGVDPVPTLQHPVVAECHVMPQRSAEFLARGDLARVFADGPPELVFIDGLHTFTAVLDDLIGVEAIAGPRTLVAVHDTIPLDEPTQRPERVHAFYTGDVWKLLPALWDARPDLGVTTVRTSPSGLTLITGLDPTNRTLADRRAQILSEYGRLPFSMAATMRGATLADDWDEVHAYLVARGLGGPHPPARLSQG